MFVFGGFVVGVFFAVEAIHHFNYNKNSEGDNKEVDDVLEKIAVGDVGDGICTKNIRNIDGESGEI